MLVQKEHSGTVVMVEEVERVLISRPLHRLSSHTAFCSLNYTETRKREERAMRWQKRGCSKGFC